MKILRSKNSKIKEPPALPGLFLCIIMDVIGMVSFSIPFVGEFSDVIWAPLSGLIYFRLFGGKMGVFGGMISFWEELLPFTDILPTFTLSWLIRRRNMQKEAIPIQTILVNAK